MNRLVNMEKKEDYKDTTIGMIPIDWEIVTLGNKEISDITDGSHYSPKEDKNGRYRIATVANIKHDSIDLGSCKRISDIDYEKLVRNGCKAEVGDVLFSKDGTVGLSFSFKQNIDVVLLSSIAIIRHKEIINPDYCAYVLKSPMVFRQIMGSKRGTGLKRIILQDLKRVKFPLPPLPEQKKIATILMTIDGAIQKVDEIIAKTDKIMQGLINKFFREDIQNEKFVSLRNIFDVKTGTTPSTNIEKYWDNPTVNWLTPADLGKLNGQVVIEESERKISEVALKETNLNLMPRESIIISTRAPVGYLAVLKRESTFNQGCKGLLPRHTSKVNPYYYSFYLLSKKYVLQNRAGQSTFKEISKDMLEKFEVPDIDIIKQNRVVEILLTINKKLELERERKENLEIVKKGLMTDLLTGRKRLNLRGMCGQNDQVHVH